MPVHDDRLLFEFLILEGAQAGLSWATILRKRENYRLAFDNFEPALVARYDDQKVAELLANPGIVRNRLKIASAIQNARCFLQVQEEFGSFSAYMWQFVGGQPRVNAWRTMAEIPAETEESRRFQQRPDPARLPLRRPHHHLRPHAGGRHGQRPRGGLLPLRRAYCAVVKLTLVVPINLIVVTTLVVTFQDNERLDVATTVVTDTGFNPCH